MPAVMEKESAHKLIDRMPQQATWDDLMHEMYVREAIERGLADSKAGRTKDDREVRAKFGPARMKVHWTDTAVDHLEAIYAYIAHDSPEYA